jgi:iron complex outermembrane recepter protein
MKNIRHLARTPLALAVALLSAGAAPTAGAQGSVAADQRVEITGSSIRRIQSEGALPVLTLNREQIERTGATSVADLVQALPSMQGFTNEGASVGGGGNGFSGASLHNMGEVRTLVLLNGRRMASFAGQNITGSLAGIDLNTIPIAAIERVEILADGASALYGADAIGGVVNFITRRNVKGLELNAGGTWPGKGARETRVSLAGGLGDLDRQGFNVLFGVNAEKRTKLNSVDREFARTGVIPTTIDGRPVTFFNGSPRGIPANITHDAGTPADGSDDYLVSPFHAANGRCPAQHVALQEGPGGTACYYDFVQQLEIFPERERQALFGQLNFKLGADHLLFAEVMASKTKNTNRIAPPPGEVSVGPSSPFWSFVLQGNPAQTADTTVPYRVADVGKRTQIDTSRARHVVLGAEGVLTGWDYSASVTRSVNKFNSDLAGGYVELGRFLNALDTGLINPFVAPGNQSPAAQQALNDARILGFWEGGEFTLDFVQARGSHELGKLPGGALALGLGLSQGREQFEKSASAIAQGVGGQRFGDDAGIVPYTAKRSFTGLFGELIAPVTKAIELSAALRQDRYSDFGNATTAKFSGSWKPNRMFLLRGSFGSGFKAPSVPQTSATRQLFGVTGAPYTCGAGSELAQVAAALGAICPVGNVQYNVYAEGNRELEPEKSRQWTLGLRVEPTANFSVGFDLWEIRLKNAIGQLDEATVMNNALQFRGSFTRYTDPATNDVLLALYLPNANLGDNTQRGLDVDAQARFQTPIGRLTSTLGLSYHLKDSYQLQRGGAFFTSLGQFGPDGNVVFRWQGRFINTLEHGNFAHTLTVAFKSGYADQPYTAADFAFFDPDTFQSFAYNGKVAKYATLDWQTRWKITPMLTLTAGVLNLTDQDPPRSFKTSGGGQMIGYDDRYYDPRGRSVYANLGLKF